MYPLIAAATAHEHQDDLLREAEDGRLARTVQHDHGWRIRLGRALSRLDGTLSRLGTRLACDASACTSTAI
jgi:hypothetical protein